MFLELRLHGRGGQGVVTAAEMLAEAAVLEGFFAQSVPMFGAERRGAPVSASARIADAPIRKHSQIQHPDMLAVFDPLLLYMKEVFEGATKDTTVVLNSAQMPDLKGHRVVLVDATRIATERGLVSAGWAILSTTMFGAISGVLGIIRKETALSVVKGRWVGDLGERNADAAAAGFEGARL